MAAEPRIGIDLRDVPKPRGGLRTLTLLDVRTARTFETLVAEVAPAVLATRARGSFGLVTSSSDLAAERAAWRGAVRTATWSRAAIRSDVFACYPSITAGAVRRGLAAAGAHPHDAERLLDILGRIERASLAGLPVGPLPSAIVAESVLSLADRAVEGTGAAIVRWVDDVVIAGPDGVTTRRAFDAWRTRLRALGLEPHEGKTALLESGCGTWEPSRSWARGHGMMRAP